MENTAQGSITRREQLIMAGIDELNEYGIHNFSTRRVAKACGISCAAPYKHFKDSHDFIAAILGHINNTYYEHQKGVLNKYADCDSRTQLLEVALDYIRFLVEHPVFRRVIMQNYQDCDEEYRVLRGQLSDRTYRVVSRYCRDVAMPPDVRKRKTFIVRSIIYGAALFFDNGEMEYNEENMQMVRDMLTREFDLP